MTQQPIEKFWMVWNVQRNAPRHQHTSKKSAQAEARRLSANAPGELFVVLAAVDAVIAPILDPQPVKLVKPKGDLDDDIPF